MEVLSSTCTGRGSSSLPELNLIADRRDNCGSDCSLRTRSISVTLSANMRFLSIFVMLLAGFCLSIQGPVNARLRLALESPVFAATISFLCGSLVLLCIMATGALGGIGTGVRGFQSAPLWAYLGGILGIGFVLGSIIAVPNVGVVVTVSAAILGQMLGSFLVDTFGWFGVNKIPFDPLRLLGSALLVTGVLLVQRK
jgi:bacterial/archaeal transporter family-2 protein